LNIPFDQFKIFDLSSIRWEKGQMNIVDRGEKKYMKCILYYLYFIIFFRMFEAETFIILIEI